jgi:hypothetical protein
VKTLSAANLKQVFFFQLIKKERKGQEKTGDLKDLKPLNQFYYRTCEGTN